MFPTRLDFDVQRQMNEEHILKVGLLRQLYGPKTSTRRGWSSHIVRFGAWLEKVGCSLQTRFSPTAQLDLGGTTIPDAHLQRC